MKATEFNQLLKHPERLTKVSFDTLDNLLSKHPFCAGLRMLLLKKYKQENHQNFDQQLPLASMYAPDRSKLYDFLHKKNQTPPTPQDQAKDKKNDQSEEKKTKIKTQLVAPPPIFHLQVSQSPPSLSFEQEAIKENEAELEQEKEQLANNKADLSLSSMPIEEWLSSFEPPRISESGGDLVDKKGFKLNVPALEKGLLDFLDEEETNNNETPTPKTPSPKEEEVVEKKVAVVNEEVEKVDKKEAVASPKTKEVSQIEDETTKAKDELEDVFNIFVDKAHSFVSAIQQKSGKDSTKKKKDLEDWEDDSTEEHDDGLISETLADLLAAQGKNDKAKEMYKALSLKFPEKSRLFADKIAQLDS